VTSWYPQDAQSSVVSSMPVLYWVAAVTVLVLCESVRAWHFGHPTYRDLREYAMTMRSGHDAHAHTS
jgi:hypothetical protein